MARRTAKKLSRRGSAVPPMLLSYGSKTSTPRMYLLKEATSLSFVYPDLKRSQAPDRSWGSPSSQKLRDPQAPVIPPTPILSLQDTLQTHPVLSQSERRETPTPTDPSRNAPRPLHLMQHRRPSIQTFPRHETPDLHMISTPTTITPPRAPSKSTIHGPAAA